MLEMDRDSFIKKIIYLLGNYKSMRNIWIEIFLLLKNYLITHKFDLLFGDILLL